MSGETPFVTALATPPTATPRPATGNESMPTTRENEFWCGRLITTSTQHGYFVASEQSLVLSGPDLLPPGAYAPDSGGMFTCTSEAWYPLATAESIAAWMIPARVELFAAAVAPASAATSAAFCCV